MTDFLLFTLYAPLASWGEIAVGEIRPSWDRPSRSAVLGFIAGALGIVRDDQTAHDALDDGYGIAVRLDAAGSSLVDYHTAQSVAASVVKKHALSTRADLMAWRERETILSRRTYRQDALATVGLWPRARARWTLTELADALRRPTFVPYAGRKANPLGLPVAPTQVTAPTLADAFVVRARLVPNEPISMLEPPAGWGGEIAHDSCDGFETGLRLLRREMRRDAAAHRGRWQFGERVVEISVIEPDRQASQRSSEVNA